MIRALKTAALGMAAQQLNVDVIANNLANVNTTGFKKSNIEFQDLLYESLQSGKAGSGEKFGKPTSLEVGLGNRPISTYRSFSQGNISQTGNALDVAINGDGFLQVEKPDGSIAYTRDGALKVTADGQLVTNSGYHLFPDINIPSDASDIAISPDGTVLMTLPGDSESEVLGQLELAMFMNPAGLNSIGSNLYEISPVSGEAILSTPGEFGTGTVLQGYLEKSNVDVAEEMIELIVAQRAYELNTKAVKTADELLSMTNNLRR